MSRERVVTPKFRVSFPSVFRPNEFNGKSKYSVLMLFNKDEDITALKKLVKDTAMEKWNKIPKPFKSPFRDGDTEKDLEKYPSFENTTFVTAQSGADYPPAVVDQKRQPILDESEFYAGCYARAAVTAYAWEFQGKKGVSINLGNVQKMGEGEKLGGGSTVNDEFDEVDVEVSTDEYDLDDI